MTITKKKMAGDFGHRPFSVAGQCILLTIKKTIFPEVHKSELRTFFEV
ncbi:hypothetical protein [Methylophaga sp.]